MGVKSIIKEFGQEAGDKIAKLSVLSPEQLEKVADQRDKYLSEMPDPKNDPEAIELTDRLLAANSIEIYNAYLPQLHDLYVPVQKNAEYVEIFDESHNIRYFNITKWVTDKTENSLEKLVNVYEVLSNEECNIALIFHRSMSGTETYLAVTNTKNASDNTDITNYKNRIADAIRGNFPGAEWKDGEMGTVPCLDNEEPYSVATATNIPTEKSEKFISQTIEKLLDGVVPDTAKKEYTLILLATPIQNIEERKLRLAEFYSGLAPYAGWSTNYTYTETGSEGSSATFGVNVGASAGIQHGSNQSVAKQKGETDSEQNSESDNWGKSENESKAHSDSKSNGETNSINQAHSEGENESEAITGGTNLTTSQNASLSVAERTGAGLSVPGGLANISSDTTVTGTASVGISEGISISTSKRDCEKKSVNLN